jgi:AhpD family alkylhydroperoxidase
MSTIRHIRPVPSTAASGLVARVYEQARRDFALAPPILVHSPIPDLLAGMWCVLRETLVAGALPRPVKEATAAAISRLGRCPYCVDAHTLMLTAAGRGSSARAIAAGRDEAVQDEETRQALAWAAANRSPGAPGLAQPPYPGHAAEMIGTALAFHYINRVAHVFLPDSFFSLPPGTGWANGLVKGLVARVVAGKVKRRYSPGDSLALLPDVSLPADLPWARSDSAIAGAYARFATSVDAAGRDALSEGVRDLVLSRLAAWVGADPGLGNAWLEEALAELPDEDRAAGRLALLIAFASYRVDGPTVAAYRVRYPEDRHLVGAVAWASYVAARRVGEWLWAEWPEANGSG